MVKCSYGSGCFTMMNIGSVPVRSHADLFTTVAWEIKGRTTYALEGSVLSCETTLRWLRETLFDLHTPDALYALAESVPDSGGVSFLPAFEGLGAPRWRPDARGALAGLSPGTTRGHLVRAALEGLSHQVLDVVQRMSADIGVRPSDIRVDGRNAKNMLVQSLADLALLPVHRYNGQEPRAFGAAWLAAQAIGYWPSGKTRAQMPVERTFEPRLGQAAAEDAHRRWKQAFAH